LKNAKVKTKRTKERHVGHNSGGVGRPTTTSLDDESNQNYNSHRREFG
jgi:hypothetical protein